MLALPSSILVQKMFWTFCQITLYKNKSVIWVTGIALLLITENFIHITLCSIFHCHHINTCSRETMICAVPLQETPVRLKSPLNPDSRATGRSVQAATVKPQCKIEILEASQNKPGHPGNCMVLPRKLLWNWRLLPTRLCQSRSHLISSLLM